MKKSLMAGIAALAFIAGPAMAGDYMKDKHVETETRIEQNSDRATLGERDRMSSESVTIQEQTAEMSESDDELLDKTHEDLNRLEDESGISSETEIQTEKEVIVR